MEASRKLSINACRADDEVVTGIGITLGTRRPFPRVQTWWSDLDLAMQCSQELQLILIARYKKATMRESKSSS